MGTYIGNPEGERWIAGNVCLVAAPMEAGETCDEREDETKQRGRGQRVERQSTAANAAHNKAGGGVTTTTTSFGMLVRAFLGGGEGVVGRLETQDDTWRETVLLSENATDETEQGVHVR